MYSIRTWLYLDWDSESIVLITGYLALGGGFIHIFFLNFYPDPWEDSIQFDFRIFFRWVGSTTNQLKPPTHMTDGKSRFEDAFPVGKWRFSNVRLVFRGMFLAFGQLSIHKCHGSSLVPKALWLAQGFGAKVQVALLASLIEKHPPPNPCFFCDVCLPKMDLDMVFWTTCGLCVCKTWISIFFLKNMSSTRWVEYVGPCDLKNPGMILMTPLKMSLVASGLLVGLLPLVSCPENKQIQPSRIIFC